MVANDRTIDRFYLLNSLTSIAKFQLWSTRALEPTTQINSFIACVSYNVCENLWMRVWKVVVLVNKLILAIVSL